MIYIYRSIDIDIDIDIDRYILQITLLCWKMHKYVFYVFYDFCDKYFYVV